MSLFSYRNDTNSNWRSRIPRSAETYVYIAEVKKVYGDYTDEDIGAPVKPGTILVNIASSSKGGLKVAWPLDDFFISLPVIGETVEVVTLSGIAFYRRINFTSNINNSYIEIEENPETPTTTVPKSDYKNRTLTSDKRSSSKVKMGERFTPSLIHRMKLSEGDTLIQSRFGQSIRFSGHDDETGKFAPIITIRNREADETIESESEILSVTENINKDGSIIQISSGQYKTPFIPGEVTPSGTNFKLKVYEGGNAYAYESYPKVLDGDQMVITSDRLIFSSRKNEMIFWAKGNYGIITDSIFSIDANIAVNIVSQKNVMIEAKESQFNVNVGKSGKINLGIGDDPLSPAVDGIELSNLLGEILDELENLANGGIFTPAGPTAGLNPVNKSAITAMRGKIRGILSTKVWLSK